MNIKKDVFWLRGARWIMVDRLPHNQMKKIMKLFINDKNKLWQTEELRHEQDKIHNEIIKIKNPYINDLISRLEHPNGIFSRGDTLMIIKMLAGVMS